MTHLIEGPDSVFLTTSARLFDDRKDVASSAWAYDKIIPNKHYKWILANYVEADNPNRNNQYWSLDNLKLAQPTISHSPLNMDHQASNIIGTIVSSEFQYPVNTAIEDNDIYNPYIEVLGAMWKFYFPDALEKVEQAYDSGALFISMECIAESISCSECHGEWEYAGPIDSTYCNHVNNRESAIEFNNPHFLAGGLITPPNRPGWKNAYTNEIAKISDEEADRTLTAIKAESPDADLSLPEWEELMFKVQLQRFTKVN